MLTNVSVLKTLHKLMMTCVSFHNFMQVFASKIRSRFLFFKSRFRTITNHFSETECRLQTSEVSQTLLFGFVASDRRTQEDRTRGKMLLQFYDSFDRALMRSFVNDACSCRTKFTFCDKRNPNFNVSGENRTQPTFQTLSEHIDDVLHSESYEKSISIIEKDFAREFVSLQDKIIKLGENSSDHKLRNIILRLVVKIVASISCSNDHNWPMSDWT